MIGIVATALAAVGLNPLQSTAHVKRTAEAALRQANREAEATALKARHAAEASDQFYAHKRETEADAAALLAVRHELGQAIARELQQAVLAPWAALREQPLRSHAAAIAKAIAAADTQTREELGCEIWDRAIFLSLLAPFVDSCPGIVTADPVLQVQIGHNLARLSTAEAVEVPAVLEELLSAEKAIAHICATHARIQVGETARGDFEFAMRSAERTLYHTTLEANQKSRHITALATAPQSQLMIDRANGQTRGRNVLKNTLASL